MTYSEINTSDDTLSDSNSNVPLWDICNPPTDGIQECNPTMVKPNKLQEMNWNIYPFGNSCPENYLTHVPKQYRDNPNNTYLCLIDYPNFPIFGRFEILNAFRPDLTITNVSYPPVDVWWKIMTLGMQTWRQPLVITDPLPQLFPNLVDTPNWFPHNVSNAAHYACL